MIDEIQKAFNAIKTKNERGLFDKIYISPFKMKSGAIISIQPTHIEAKNEMDLHNFIDSIDYRFLTGDMSQIFNVQIQIEDKASYEDVEAEEIQKIFKIHGGLEGIYR
jgi:hypothetical protein